MKITFDDQSYVDLQKSSNPGKIILTICARDGNDPLKKISNSVEITNDEFKKLIVEVI